MYLMYRHTDTIHVQIKSVSKPFYVLYSPDDLSFGFSSLSMLCPSPRPLQPIRYILISATIFFSSFFSFSSSFSINLSLSWHFVYICIQQAINNVTLSHFFLLNLHKNLFSSADHLLNIFIIETIEMCAQLKIYEGIRIMFCSGTLRASNKVHKTVTIFNKHSRQV